ncbi:MAG TPA: crotonase/enoyl-CoA hydratase family protein [Solimonas sp.]
MSDRVQLQLDGAVATVTLNRPEKHNGLDLPMFHAIENTAKALRKRKDVRAVILRGEGPSFCAGLDVKSAFSSLPKFAQDFATFGIKRRNIFQEVGLCWRDLPVPVIAAIHGSCFGGGIQIALGADIRIATPDAKLSIMEVKWGLIPDMSGTVTLRELMPIDQAKLLTMTGRILSGTEARAYNLVTEVADDPLARAQELAREIAGKSPDAVSLGKTLYQRNWLVSENAALKRERRYQFKLLNSRNQRIAVKANIEKTAPDFAQRQFEG